MEVGAAGTGPFGSLTSQSSHSDICFPEELARATDGRLFGSIVPSHHRRPPGPIDGDPRKATTGSKPPCSWYLPVRRGWQSQRRIALQPNTAERLTILPVAAPSVEASGLRRIRVCLGRYRLSNHTEERSKAPCAARDQFSRSKRNKKKKNSLVRIWEWRLATRAVSAALSPAITWLDAARLLTGQMWNTALGPLSVRMVLFFVGRSATVSPAYLSYPAEASIVNGVQWTRRPLRLLATISAGASSVPVTWGTRSSHRQLSSTRSQFLSRAYCG
ncbi:hypothetical protein QBC47DRAFT_95319 [Echria macrotheca]|uniref:Uncharacterized protein n=1 Tax=Echria macrotheca TaxID=438768 RepID=A0AAJ0BKF5_9PEZI|nr:hypothetical protein QBC47DRAFT_95319 [Echria macrotheca]